MTAELRSDAYDDTLEQGADAVVLAELERRIDEALVIARGSEAAIMTVGAAAFDAADQALRAADLAERASAAIIGKELRPPEPAAGEISVSAVVPIDEPDDGSMDAFNRRADRIVARLRELGAPAG